MTASRWMFRSPYTQETWVMPLNPNKMTKLRGKKNLTTKTTAAVNGRPLFFQGAEQPQDFTFAGDLISLDQFTQMEHWVYEVPQYVTITDHLGRIITCYLWDFDYEQIRSSKWRYHFTYTVSGTVISVTEPTLPDGFATD